MSQTKDCVPEALQPGICIRPANSDDVKAIVEFNAGLAQVTEGKKLDPLRLQQGVEAVLHNPDHGFYVIAEDASSKQAIGQLLITYEWSDWRNAVFWWLQSVYVQESWRRQGVFRKLYDYVMTEARNRKTVAGVRLYVEEENRLAQQVYQHMGLLPAGYHVYELDFVLPKSS